MEGRNIGIFVANVRANGKLQCRILCRVKGRRQAGDDREIVHRRPRQHDVLDRRQSHVVGPRDLHRRAARLIGLGQESNLISRHGRSCNQVRIAASNGPRADLTVHARQIEYERLVFFGRGSGNRGRGRWTGYVDYNLCRCRAARSIDRISRRIQTRTRVGMTAAGRVAQTAAIARIEVSAIYIPRLTARKRHRERHWTARR